MADKAAPVVRVTEYVVCCLPEDDVNAGHFEITVEYRGHDRWAVKRHSDCLASDGTWDYEPSPSSRVDDWLDTHRFDLTTAIELAKQAAPHLRVNGYNIHGVRVPTEGGERNG